jgi:vacuolar-type H+-ATPase subunit H
MTDKKDSVLIAEDEAKARIQEVIQEKDDLLRQAKERAKKELRSFDDELQQKTQERITNLYIDRSDLNAIEGNTEKELRDLEDKFAKNKNEVVDYLFEAVTHIKIVIPDVVKANFENTMKY